MEREDLRRERIKRTGEIIFYKHTIAGAKKGSWMNANTAQAVITNRRVFVKLLWFIPFMDIPLHKIKDIQTGKSVARLGSLVKVRYHDSNKEKKAEFSFWTTKERDRFYEALKHARENYY